MGQLEHMPSLRGGGGLASERTHFCEAMAGTGGPNLLLVTMQCLALHSLRTQQHYLRHPILHLFPCCAGGRVQVNSDAENFIESNEHSLMEVKLNRQENRWTRER